MVAGSNQSAIQTDTLPFIWPNSSNSKARGCWHWVGDIVCSIIPSPAATSKDARMAYSIDQIKEFKAKIDLALTGGRLNAWQMKFLMNIRDRIGNYGTETRLSEKQVSKLYEIIGAGRTFGNITRLRPVGPPRPPRWRRKSYGPLAREGRRLANRFVRDLAIVSALIVAGVVYSFTQNISRPTVSGYFSTAP